MWLAEHGVMLALNVVLAIANGLALYAVVAMTLAMLR
jgi:hypothetical protein